MTKYAKTYGGALYDLAAEENLTKDILADLAQVLAVNKEIPEYTKLLQSPSIDKNEKHRLLDEAWAGHIHTYTLNFMKILCDKEKYTEICDCEKEFHSRFNDDNNILVVKAVTAAPISDELREKLAKTLAEKTKKTVELNVTVDETLIGGMKLEYDGKLLDSTVSYHIDAIKNMLRGNLN